MARFKKILVPVDLSARSLGLMNYARKLAEEFDSELLFLHAIQPQTWPLREPERETRDAIMEVLRTTRGRLLMREGLPAATILEVARSEPADGILMVTRGAKTFSMKFAGSITAQVLREAGCPVWAAAENFSLFARRPIRNILCALSLGPRTGPVLRWAAGLARRFDATLSVVHASRALESTLAHPADQEWRIWVRKMAKEDLESVQAEIGAKADVWLEAGRPVRTVSALAESLRSDLLVIGKSPQVRLLPGLRTMSYDMVCRAPCPVASV